MISFTCPSCGCSNRWEDVLLKGDLIDCMRCGEKLQVLHVSHGSGNVRVQKSQ